MKNYLILVFVLLANISLSQSVLTSSLSNELMNRDKESYEVIVYFNKQFNAEDFNKKMLRLKAEKDKRVKKLTKKLKSIAKNSQDAFLNRFYEDIRHGEIDIKQKFWIRNALLIETSQDKIYEIAAYENINQIDINSGRYTLEKPVKKEFSRSRINNTEEGLKVVNAPEMWKLGYTGRNTLFLSIDTGVFPDHPAISSRFAGNNYPLNYVWYGIRNPLPSDHSSSTHGTHTTGTVLGLDKNTNDTIGMAWNSWWIVSDPVASSASDLLDPAVFMSVFEWVLNPDGNPSTTHDVPDVINNSWGYDYDLALAFDACELQEAELIKTIEAAGISSPFSAGNEGPGSSTVGFPAMLTYNNLNAMSVAAVNGNSASYPIADFSSRGPTLCNDSSGSIKIKPEVSAPGVSVRSSSGHEQYAYLSGTSMACPHVSGALLLLKEAFPYLTSYQLKEALYNTAHDLGDTGEDNTYGNGIIDVFAAYQYLESAYQPVPPVSDSVDLLLKVQNSQNLYECPGAKYYYPEIDIINKGKDTINNINYYCSLNYGDTLAYSWSGNLLPNQIKSLSLDSVELQAGFNTIHIWSDLTDSSREYNMYNNSDIININLAGKDTLPWTETFENFESGFLNSDWFTENPDKERTWDIMKTGGSENNKALVMNCLNYENDGTQDNIYSPLIELPENDTLFLKADIAYKRRMESLFKDSLKIYVAEGCNNNFDDVILSNGGEDMATVDGNTGSTQFVPESQADWDTLKADISNFAGKEVMFKIQAVNDKGGSIYLDNIRIYEGASSVNDNKLGNRVNIFPNPADDHIFIAFNSNTDKERVISLYRIDGKMISKNSGNFKKMKISTSDLNAGLYIIKIRDNNEIYSEKLIIR